MSQLKPARPSATMVIAILALVAALAGTAFAGSEPSANTAGKVDKALKKAKKALKVAKETSKAQGPAGEKGDAGQAGPAGASATALFALVSTSGNLQFGEGATGASKEDAGKYTVTFNQSLLGCAATASAGAGSPSEGGIFASDTVATVQVGTTEPNMNQVKVQTHDASLNALTDASFHVAVFC